MDLPLIAVFIPVYATAGIVLLSLFTYLFKSNYKEHLKDNTFYLLVPSLILGDFGVLLNFSLYIIVNHLWPMSPFIDQLVGYGYSYLFFVTVFTSVTMAVNRYSVICWPTLTQLLFSSAFKMKLCSAVVWGAPLVVQLHKRLLINCDMTYQHREFGTASYDCSKNISFNEGQSILPVHLDEKQKTLYLTFSVILIPFYGAALIFLLYTRCFIELHRLRVDNQAAMISTSLILLDLVFIFSWVFGPAVVAVATVTNSTLSTVIFLGFNRVFRNSLIELLRRKCSSNSQMKVIAIANNQQ